MEGGAVQNGRRKQMKEVAAIKPVADHATGVAQPAPAAKAAGQAKGPEIQAVRLVIEEDSQSGSFVYKTLDRVTGEAVKQLPREQVVELMQAAAYSAGSVIDTKA